MVLVDDRYPNGNLRGRRLAPLLAQLWRSTNVDMPATGESGVDGASIVGDELAILGAGRRKNDGGEGKVGSVGDFLSESLQGRCQQGPLGALPASRLTSSESNRMPSTGLSSSSQSDARAIRLPASSARRSDPSDPLQSLPQSCTHHFA